MKKPFNVLVTATTFPRKSDDTSPRFIYDLCTALADHGVVSPIVLVPHYAGSARYEEIGDIKIYRYKYFFESMEKISGNGIVSNIQKNKLLALLIPFLVVSQFINTVYLIRKYNIEVILANWVVPQGFVGALVKIFNRKVRLVVVSHGGDAALLNKNKFLKKLARYILNRSDHVVAVSTFIKKKLLNTGYQSNEIDVIPMGVDVEKFYCDCNNSFLGKKDFDIVFVGRLEEKKGLQYLIKALFVLKNKYDNDTKLTIIGHGTQKELLAKLVKDLALVDRVVFTGAMEHKEIIKYLSKSRIFVAPSINLTDDIEGMPTVILEAMSVGVPLITTDAGGITDIVTDGFNGLIVEQRNPEALAIKIRDLLLDTEKQKFLSKNALEQIKKYSYKNIAMQYANVVERV